MPKQNHIFYYYYKYSFKSQPITTVKHNVLMKHGRIRPKVAKDLKKCNILAQVDEKERQIDREGESQKEKMIG